MQRKIGYENITNGRTVGGKIYTHVVLGILLWGFLEANINCEPNADGDEV